MASAMQLLEWMGYDANAQPVTTSFADYLLPGACDVPVDQGRCIWKPHRL
jgi:CO/xanthine dehydrogenase Mo-binding subunit